MIKKVVKLFPEQWKKVTDRLSWCKKALAKKDAIIEAQQKLIEIYNNSIKDNDESTK